MNGDISFAVISAISSVVFAAICSSIMHNKGYEAWRGLVMGFSLGPIGLIICLCFRKKKSNEQKLLECLSKGSKVLAKRMGNSDKKILKSNTPIKYTCNAILDPLTHEASEDQTDDPEKPHCDFKLTDADLFCPMCGSPNKRATKSPPKKQGIHVPSLSEKNEKTSAKKWTWIIVIAIILSAIFRILSANQRAETEKLRERGDEIIQKMLENQKSIHKQREYRIESPFDLIRSR